MTEEWEYIEEAIQESEQKKWLNSTPKICHTCRWFDSYYRLGCTQYAYPDTKDNCILYTHHKWFKRLWIGKRFDLHWRLWQIKVWFLEKVLRKKRNIVGNWRQWGDW